MARAVPITPSSESARKYKSKKAAKEDVDMAMFTAMTATEAEDWVDNNTTADANTKKIMKVMLKALAVFSEQLK
jgi:hypothetical protein